MDRKTTGIVSYITLIGWIVAYVAGDKQGAKFHLNQSLVVMIVSIIGGIVGSILGFIPFIGGLLGTAISVAVFVLWLIGLIGAINEEEKPLPFIGGITLLH